ncbi:retrovirus-related pol polyprotein from transposon TNT 1-94 [Tanacetum coccineum]
MANLSEDIQCAGSDTRPPMLDKTDFASWQQRIRLYCRGKENGVNILKSIDEGPFQMGTTRVIVAEGTKDKKDRYNADIQATNIILQGLPKDIYSLINHYTDAKDIWDNVKMLLEGSELTKEDRESQLYDDFEHFRQNKGETIHDYYGRFVTAVKLNKGLKDSNFDQLYAYLKQHEAHAQRNKYGRQNRGQGNNARGAGAVGYGGAQNRVGNANPGQVRQVKCYNCNGVGHIERNCTLPKRPQNSEYFKDKMLLMQAQENGVQPVQDLALKVDNVFHAEERDVPVLSEVQDHDHYQDAVCDHHEEHEMHDDYVKDDAVQEENLKKELHSVKLQLASTIQHNKLMVDEVTSLKKDFNQKENKYLEEFLDLKALKDKVEDKLFKQGQSIQTVHMMCKPRSYYDEVNKVAIGYKNPLCLHRARQVQPALYSGHVIVTPNHAPAVVRDWEETLEQSEISRKKMHDKMKANECVDNKVNITPPNYSKENFLATFTPQKQLTPEQIFWSQDIVKMKAEALKEQNTRPIKALTVYPPNTPATLVPRVLPTKSQVKINIFTLRQLFSEFEKTYKKRITPTGITEGERGFEQTKTCYLTEVIPFFKTLQEHFEGIQKALTKEVKEMSDAFDELEVELDQSIIDRKHDEIERKNLLIEHDNIIDDGLSKEVFYVASNSELNVSRFTEMQKAHNVVKARCLELEAELSNLRDNIHKDNYNELLNRFSNLEVNHLNLQLKYQNLKDSFQNKPSSSVNDTPDFNSVFVIGQMKASLQGKDNNKNELFRAENAKIKQHYKELYDSIKITRAKHTEQITALKNENESLKVQLQNTVSCVTTNQVKPKVLAPGKYAIDIEPIPPRNWNNREVHLVYLRHLKESVDTLCEIVEEAKVERPLDRSLAFACRYTKHSQELLEYVFGTCPKVFNQQDNKHAYNPRKKQVTFEDQIATSSSTTHKYVKPMHTQHSNVPLDRELHFGAIMGYGDYVIGDSVISRVYYVEGLGHNLFSVGQFCDSDLEVAFRKHSCYVRDTDGVELLKGSRGSNLYTISVEDMMKSSPICLLSKASKHKSWLWHRRLNHLNFGTINDLARKDLVRGLPRLKFEKDHLCSACQLGKSKKHTHKPKTENTNLEVLNTLHMDLCGPMRVQTINGKKYILVIVDDYSRFTWVKFLRSKDETPTVVIKFLKQIQVGLNKTVRFIRTDNGTEFVNKTLYDYYESVGIFHQKTVPRTPQQNGVVERQNRTLVEAARTMLIFSKALMFLWAEAVATACYTQNRSLIHTRHDKTPYELVHNKKPDLTFFRVFGALCYPTNDSENLGKLQPRADIGIFIGYAPSRKGYRIYNKQTRQIMETIHVQFDELTEQMAPVQSSPGPAPNLLTPGPISSGLVPNPAPALPYVPPTHKELEMLFQPMFDEYFNPPGNRQDPIPNVVQDPVIPTGPSVSISIDLDAPSGSHISSPLDHHSSSVHYGVAGEQFAEVNPFAAADPEPFVNVFAPDPTSEASSSGEIMMPELNQSTQPHEHIRKWTDSHPLDNIIGNPSQPISTQK